MISDIELYNRVTEYADKALSEIDPQKTHVSRQLELLMPVMQEIATEEGVEVDEIFIRYMDQANLSFIKKETEFQSLLEEE